MRDRADRVSVTRGVRRAERSWVVALAAVISATGLVAAGGVGVATGSVTEPAVVSASAAPAAVAARAPGPTPDLESGIARYEALREASLRGDRSPAVGVAALRSPLAGAAATTIPLGQSPYEVVINQAMHTAYVANGATTVSVVDTRTCNAHVTSGCGQPAHTVTVGPGPVSAAVDEATDTIYTVALGSDTVSVINGATCNATVTSGCGQVTPTVTVAPGPDGIAVDQATDTVYVASAGPNDDNTGHTVSVINGARCNGRVHSGCGQTPATVQVGLGPVVPAVDEATDTIYVPNSDPGGPGTVSVINGKTCNGTVHTGCSRTPPRIAVGFNTFPDSAAVDQATDTVYEVASGRTFGRVYVINGAMCNATVTAGCGQRAPTVTIGSGPTGVVVDPRTQGVFVSNEEDSTVSVIDGRICNARHTSGCDQRTPAFTAGFNGGYLDVDDATDTIYVASQDLNVVWVLDGAACTLTNQSGCRHSPPTTTVGTGPIGIALDQATHTVYVANWEGNTVSVINAAVCGAGRTAGCGWTWPTVGVGAFPWAVAVDQRTDTVYVANSNPGGPGSVSVIDGATCNAAHTSGCRRIPATVSVGGDPQGIGVNPATDTVYVTNQADNTVSVIDGATCNGTNIAGCAHTVATVRVGTAPAAVAVDTATDTVYVTNAGDNTLSVIDGRTCDARHAGGCAEPAPTVAAGVNPDVLAVNQATDTVYVADQGADNPFNDAEPERTSLVSVIKGATCNARTAIGCGQKPATLRMDGDPLAGIAVDPARDRLYVTSLIDSDVDVFSTARCDGTHHGGCAQTPARVLVGGWPSEIAINEATGSVYASDNVDGTVSYFAFRRPARVTGLRAVADGRTVRLHWTQPAAGRLPIRYQIIPFPACGTCGGRTTTGATSTTITGLKPHTTYTFTVRAIDAAGPGPRSAPSRRVRTRVARRT